MRVRRSLLVGLGIIMTLSVGAPVMATESMPFEYGVEHEYEHAYTWNRNTEGKWELTVKVTVDGVETSERATDGVYKCDDYHYYLIKDGVLEIGASVVVTEGDLCELDEADKEIVAAGTYLVETEGETPEEGLGSLVLDLHSTLDESDPGEDPEADPDPEEVSLTPGWQNVDGKWLYGKEDGSRATGKTGWQHIEGKYYFLNEDGSVDTSKNGILENDGKYLNAANGVAVPAVGFQKINGATYYLNSDGSIEKYIGWVSIGGKAYYFNGQNQVASQNINGWKQIGGNWYWFENGNTATGWRSIGGKWYYMDPQNGIMKTGFFTDSTGQKYYCDGSGAMVGGGWHKLGNNWYWMYNSGAIAGGWLKQGSTWYYLDPSTGAMKTGWYEVDGQRYYSDGSGAMCTGWLRSGNNWYYLNGSGAMHRGWAKLGNTWYYLEPSTGVMKTGWYEVKGTVYFSDGSGAMHTGWLKDGNNWYYFNNSGAKVTGWIKLGSTWYYLDSKTSVMKTGWFTAADGLTYYADSSGALAMSRWIGDYYVGSSGALAVNSWIGDYWVGSDGKWIPNYLPDSVAAQTVEGTWIRSNGNWYFQDKSGNYVTGWKYIGKYKYYFDSTGKLIQDLDSVIGKQSSYYITVNRANCQIMVYAKDETGRYCVPVKTFACSVGLPGTPTPTGTYAIHTQQKVVELMGPSWGKYGSLVVPNRGIWFHSVACSSADPTYSLSAANYNMLGQPASHGCIRLCVRDAKWIYDNCHYGTTVEIGDSVELPFDKPATIKIPAGRNWDPTDPEA